MNENTGNLRVGPDEHKQIQKMIFLLRIELYLIHKPNFTQCMASADFRYRREGKFYIYENQETGSGSPNYWLSQDGRLSTLLDKKRIIYKFIDDMQEAN